MSKWCMDCKHRDVNSNDYPCCDCIKVSHEHKIDRPLWEERVYPSEPRTLTITRDTGFTAVIDNAHVDTTAILANAFGINFRKTYDVDRILVSNETTIVFWKDGDKTVVKKSADDTFDIHHAFCCALAKKVYGGHNSTVKKMIERKTTVQKKKEKKNKDVVVETVETEERRKPGRASLITEDKVRDVVSYYKQGYTNAQIKEKLNWDSNNVDWIVDAVRNIFRGRINYVRSRAGETTYISKRVLFMIEQILNENNE